MKVLKDIPGFERRKLHCIDSSDILSKVDIAGKLIGELRTIYGTSVAYFSTHGKAQEVERLQAGYPSAASLYAIDLSDKDTHRLCDTVEDLVAHKYVRAVVIDCLEDLEIDPVYYNGGTRAKRNEIKTNLYLLATGCNIPVLLFCPYRKSHRYEDDGNINPFASQILPQFTVTGKIMIEDIEYD